MTKTTIGLGLLGIGATTSVAAPLAMTLGGGTGDSTEQETIFPGKQPESETIKWTKSVTKLSSAKDIEEKYKEIECVKEKFQSINEWKGGATSADSDGLNFNTSSKGCLIVESYKQKYENNKWLGELRLVWSVEDSQHGLITVVDAKTENAGLLVESAIYVLGKDSSEGSWKVKYNKDHKKTVSNEGELTNLFPKAGELITEGAYKDKYWGFDIDFPNICGSNECKNKNENASESSVIWEFAPDTSNGKPFYKLFNDLSSWFQTSFKVDKQIADLLMVEYTKIKLTKK